MDSAIRSRNDCRVPDSAIPGCKPIQHSTISRISFHIRIISPSWQPFLKSFSMLRPADSNAEKSRLVIFSGVSCRTSLRLRYPAFHTCLTDFPPKNGKRPTESLFTKSRRAFSGTPVFSETVFLPFFVLQASIKNRLLPVVP